jgi:hypothetical protein
MGLADQFLQDASQPQDGGNSLSAQFASDIAPTQPQQKMSPQEARDADARRGMDETFGRLGQMLYGAAKGAADLVQAPAQLLLHGTNSIIQSVPPTGPFADQMKRMQQAYGGLTNQFDAHLKNQEQQYQADTPGSFSAGLGRIAAGVVPFLASGGTSAATQATQAVGALPKILNAAKMAGMGAGYATLTQPVTNVGANQAADDFYKQKAKQAGIGALSVLGGQALGNLAARVIRPNTNPEVQALISEGITPTPGQILGGGFKRAEDAATSIPVLGDMVKNAQRRSFQDLNTAAVNRSLAPINETLPSGVTGRDAIDYAGKKLGDAYDAVLSKIGAVVPDAKFTSDIGSLTTLTKNLPQQQADQFQKIVQNEILDRIDNGAITAEGLKAAESNLGNMWRNYTKSQDYDTRQLGTALQEAQATLRNLVQRTNPDQAKVLQSINNGWANFLRVQRASSSLGAEGGVFTPAQLQNSVKALDSSKNKGAFARGDALMQDLSEAAKNVMGNKVPDSGTPLRHAIQGGIAAALGHSYLPGVASEAIPIVAMGGALASAPYTALGQKMAAAALTRRPSFAGPLSSMVRSGAPFAGAAVSPLLLQMSENQSN